ncbi:MAG TPA: type II secretion system protein [Kofleriaceae bacterium]|jgi:general secretion pathway protein I|nr:type II secretion system protein [Kofleriaceae bacterium]
MAPHDSRSGLRSGSRSGQARRARRRGGFTLLEVMIALALLGFALTVVIKSAAGNIFNAQQAHMMGIATDLARGKMYDIEDKLIKDGFSDTEQHEEDQAFTEEGWPLVKYSYKVEVVELPSFEDLQAIAAGRGSGAGSGSSLGSALGSGSGRGALGSDFGSDFGSGSGSGGFENSVLGGMLSQFGGLGGSSKGAAGAGSGSDINSTIGSAFVQSQYTMFQQILKVSIRKVSLTVKWQVLGSDRDMTVVTFFTDAGSMDKVINGMGSQDLDDANAAKGSGSGSSRTGSGSGSSRTTTPVTGH